MRLVEILSIEVVAIYDGSCISEIGADPRGSRQKGTKTVVDGGRHVYLSDFSETTITAHEF